MLPLRAEQIVLNAWIALTGSTPGHATFNSHVNFARSANGIANWTSEVNSFVDASFARTAAGTASLADAVIANLGLGAVAGIRDMAIAHFNSQPTNRGGLAIEAADWLRNTTFTDTALISAQTAFRAANTGAFNHSSNPGNLESAAATPGAPLTVTGRTFALTTGADNVTGTSGNDVISGAISSGAMTFDALDSISGGAGNDILNISGNAAGIYQAASLAGVETVNLNSTAATATVSLLGATGVTTVASIGSTAAAAFSNIGSTSVGLQVKNSSAAATFGYTAAAVAGTADSATLTLSNVAAGTVTVNGIETLNLVSNSGANSITLAADAATTLNVTGDQNLTLGTAPATITTIGAADFTGVLSVTMGAAATVNGGAGNDSITMGAAAAAESVNAGAGNDTIIFAAHLSNTDTINGGDGTDKLSTTAALAEGYTAPTTATITNVETLILSTAGSADTTLTTANLSTGINTVQLAAGTATGTYGIIGPAGTLNVVVNGGTLGGALTLTDTGTATSDVANLSNTRTTATTDVLNGKNLVSVGYETLNIAVGSGNGPQTIGTIGVTADTGGTTTVNFTGANAVSTTGAITANVINASGLTGAAALTMGVAAVGVTSITGSANADTLRGDASSTIDGGAGNDSITGGSGNDNLSGGAGNDTITAAAGNDVINGGAGNDTLVLGGDLAVGDVIDGGDGTDTLSVSNATLATVNGYSISAAINLNNAISNVERVLITDDLNQGTFDMARLDSINHITLGGKFTGAQALTGLAAATTVRLTTAATDGTDNLTLTLADATGTSDTITINTQQAAATDFADVTISGIESVTLVADEAPANTALRIHDIDINATGMTTLTITGTEAVNLSGANISAATVDASGNTGGINITGAATGSSMTITGTSAADTITGGVAADTIVGGAGADSLVGGAGADSINGGAGADTITGGTGNDRVDLGAADAAIDHYLFGATVGGADNIDQIINFTAGATHGDVFDATSLTAAFLNTTTELLENITTTTTAGAGNANILLLSLGHFADSAAVQTALASGGTVTLGSGIAGVAANVLVAYQATANGDVRIASANVADAGGFTAVQDLAVLVGVTSLTSLNAANFMLD